LPDAIPGHFTVDVTELMMGQSVRAGDIAMPPEVKLVSAPENVIAHVVALRIVEEEKPAEAAVEGAVVTPEAGATAAEPEVIKKGKKEEEAAEPETKGKKK
jgi:large subunit ribosomal protein L25